MKKTHSRKSASTPAARGFTLVPKRKCRPRGRPFPKGNKIGPRFPKGICPNPEGRPRSAEISRASRAWLAQKTTVEELAANKLPLELADCTHAEVIAWIRGQQALEGNLPSAIELADRSEGKPRTMIEFDHTDPLSELLAEMREESEKLGPPPEDDQPAPEVVQ